MGFGYDTIKQLNPKIIMINVSAYGQYGPYRDRIGFDSIGQALGDLMQMTGFPNGPPIRTFFPLIDRITALHAAIGALAALREREISGEGQAIDVSLADTGFTVNEIPITAYPADGTIQQREGNGRGPVNAYPTADGWIYLLASNQAAWERLCHALERPSGWRTLASPNRPGGKSTRTSWRRPWWSGSRRGKQQRLWSIFLSIASPPLPSTPLSRQPATHTCTNGRSLWRSRTPWRDASTCRGNWSSSARRRWW